MTLVLKNADSTESVELAWSEKLVKHLLSMGVKPKNADSSPIGTKLFYEVADPQTVKKELQKAGVL